MSSLSAVEVTPEVSARASVIWLHGLGADGHDFEAIVPELRLPAALGVRFLFPHAPLRPVTINQGYIMRAWYDVAQLDLSQEEDESGIRTSERLIRELIEQERTRGVTAAHIALAGFSQGGAVALHTALRYGERLAGILTLSAYLPLPACLAAEASPANADVPIMMAHGTNDTVIPVRLARESRDHLQRLGYRVQWHTYPMAHGVSLPEVGDTSEWLQRILA
jgi:phospholipase/carboxylesterase